MKYEKNVVRTVRTRSKITGKTITAQIDVIPVGSSVELVVYTDRTSPDEIVTISLTARQAIELGKKLIQIA